MSDNDFREDGFDIPAKPENTAPTDDEAAQAEVKSDETDSAEVTPDETASAEVKSGEAMPAETKPEENFGYTWGSSSPAGKPPKKKSGGLKIAVAALSICLVFALVALSAVLIGNNQSPEEPANSQTPAVSQVEESESEVSYQEFIKKSESSAPLPDYSSVYKKCAPSCVTVIVDNAMGSGFVIDESGHILTNHHVIDGASKITVHFYDGRKFDAELIGSDEVSDIAVLKINAEGLVPLEIGDSDNLVVGEAVTAIGTPYDISLAGTMNTGIISGIARDVEVTNDYGTVVKTMTLIQTDTSINPGNSGGPLLNMNGQVIGINTLKLMDVYEGLGFAIPINNAVTIANIILTHGEVSTRPDDDFVSETAKLNITVMNVSDAIEQGVIEEDEKLPDGAMVIEVSRGSAIYKAGLELYDIITEFDGTEITTKDDLITELGKHSGGDRVQITVFRIDRSGIGGEYITLSFKLDYAK